MSPELYRWAMRASIGAVLNVGTFIVNIILAKRTTFFCAGIYLDGSLYYQQNTHTIH